VSSRRRLYLNLKQGIVELFRTTAHWLSDFTGRWSLYEKPYLDQDYRAMHVKFPVPTWAPPGGGGGGGGGEAEDGEPESPWPKEPGLRTFIWDPGICTVGVIRGTCGEQFTLEASIGISSPWETFGIGWNAFVLDPASGQVIEADIGLSSWSVDIKGIVADDFTGTLVVCVTAVNLGKLRHTLVVEAAARTTYQAALMLPPLSETYYSGNSYPCGCAEIEVTCCDDTAMEWDADVSPETIAREASVTVAIKDSGSGGPYTWSVSGTGFTLDEVETTGVTNTLNADAIACGTATITVTGWDCGQVIGYVRCTTGQWSNTKYDVCEPCNYHTGWDCTTIIGNKQYYAEMTSSTDGQSVCPYECVPVTFELGQGPLKPATCPEDAPSGYAWITYSYYNKWIC